MSRHDELMAALAALPLELSEHVARLEAGLQSFSGSTSLKGARNLPVDRALLWAGPGRLAGWSLTLPAGATTACLAVLRDSRRPDGDVLGAIAVAVGAASNHVLGGNAGVSFTEGLYLDVLAGQGLQLATPSKAPALSLLGAVHIGAVD